MGVENRPVIMQNICQLSLSHFRRLLQKEQQHLLKTTRSCSAQTLTLHVAFKICAGSGMNLHEYKNSNYTLKGESCIS